MVESRSIAVVNRKQSKRNKTIVRMYGIKSLLKNKIAADENKTILIYFKKFHKEK